MRRLLGARLAGAIPDRRTRTIAAFAALGITLTTLAVLYDGTEVADLELNDGGVWVTYLDTGQGYQVAGHLNYRARKVDSYAELSTSSGTDITQEANAVVTHQSSSQAAMAAIDTATWATGSPSELPRSATAPQGADIVAVTDPNKGVVWAVPASEASNFSAESATPVLEDVLGVRTSVSKGDVIYALTPDGTIQRVRQDDTGWSTAEAGSVPPIGDGDDVQLAVIGETPVVYDADAGWIAWPDHQLEVDGIDGIDEGEGLTLQQSGDDTGRVALAADDALVLVPLDGGDPSTDALGASGSAITPVSVGACTYAAWSGSGAYVRDCTTGEGGGEDDETRTVTKLQQNPNRSDWSFRTNRDLVVLNDSSEGTIILVNEDMEVLDDPWQDVRNELQDDKDDSQDDTVHQTRRDNRNPPEPKDDDFGVRAGGSITLPVLANDVDSDGDVLTVQLDGRTQTPVGGLESVRDGRAVRLTVPDDASGQASFGYQAFDGKYSAPATVHVTVRDQGQNGGARLLAEGLRKPELTIKERRSGSYPVLQDYIDKDGDATWISDVSASRGLSTVWEPDGVVTVTDQGRESDGRTRTVTVTLTDGRGRTTPVSMPVEVLPLRARNEPPVANADFLTVLQGSEALVKPVRNDVDPDSPELYATMTDVPADLKVTDVGDHTYAVHVGRRAKPGPYYVSYELSDGESTAESVIRVDVRAPDAAAPVPDNDLAVVPPGGETVVPVLANDTDPLGGLLVLSSVSAPRNANVTAEVVDHQFLRIRHRGALGSARVTYSVANAAGTAQGEVTVVVPEPEEPKRSGPVAGDDEGVVRSGDVVSIDVLDNDSDPTDQRLTVLPDLDVTVGADLGDAFVSEDKVRFFATGEAGDVRIQYQVTDPDGNVDVAKVRLAIQPTSGSNLPPVPKALTARLFQGGTVEIPVALDSIDPDGDSVTLVGVDGAPRHGQVVVGTDTITYRAGKTDLALGTDTFSYQVEDEYGATAFGQVQVGIVAPPVENRPPIAIGDTELQVRPDRLLSIPVTANDNDPEGGTLTLADVQPVDGTTTTADVADDGRVELRTPDEPTTLHYLYTIKDDLGATAEGVIQVRVSSHAPALPPIARDDRVPLAQVIEKDTVTVEVLRNDEDPDGAVSTIAPDPEVAGVEPNAAGELVIPVRAERQLIPYTLTDPDGEEARAVVIVPGNGTDAARRPTLRDNAPLPIKVKAGESKDIDLRDLVLVRKGREPVVHLTEDVHAGPGHDGSELKTADSVITFGALGSEGGKPGFYGPTSVTALVWDGPSDDPDAASSVIAIPIEVTSDGMTQPSLHIPEIEVAPNEDPWTRPLQLLATDPDKGDQEHLAFRASKAADGRSDGLALSTDDGRLSVSVDDSVDAGDTRSFVLEVKDGSTEPVAADVLVRVVDSTRPLLQLEEGVTYEAEDGEPVDIHLDDLVVKNPYPDQPVTLVGSPAAPSEAATVDRTDDGFSVTPRTDYHGTFEVNFQVADASGSEDRYVAGTIQVVVVAAPDTPTIQGAEAVDATSAEVNWLAGDSNGSPITGFEINVRGDQPVSVQGQQSSATVRNLTSGKEYRFQVRAINEVGPSGWSEWSNPVTPDEFPTAPTGVTIEAGDQRVIVKWKKPVYQGTPPKTYIVRLNGKRVDTRSTATSYEGFRGLVNGGSYTVEVKAVNEKQEPGTDGDLGAGPWASAGPVIPVGDPTASSVVALPDPPDDDPSTDVTWKNAPNGGTVTAAKVRIAPGGPVVGTCSGPDVDRCHVRLRVGKDDQFQVSLQNEGSIDNKSGWGPWSDASNPVRGARAPKAVPDFDPAATGQSGTATFSFTYSQADGGEADDVRFEVSGANATAPITGFGSHTVTVNGLTNGSPTTVSVRAITISNGLESAPSGAGTGSANAFAPCTISVSPGTPGAASHTFDWSVRSFGRECRWGDDPSGHGLRGDGQATESGAAGATFTHTMWVDTITSGDDGPANEDSPKSATGRSLTPTADYSDSSDTCSYPGWSNCRYAYLTLRNWKPGSSVTCHVTGVGAPSATQSFTVDQSGNWGPGRTKFKYNEGGGYEARTWTGDDCG